jgi:hypothetical protein
MMTRSKTLLMAVLAVSPWVLVAQGCMLKTPEQRAAVVQSPVSPPPAASPNDIGAPQAWHSPRTWTGSEKWLTQSRDCRSCHVKNGPPGAKDFSQIYANQKSHHPVGVAYPVSGQDTVTIDTSKEQAGAVVGFFDRNGNGRPDGDEVILFGSNGALMVECASCHREHGAGAPSAGTQHRWYLRVENGGSELCLTCHNQ